MDTAKKYILAIDQGTTSSRAILFNKQGNVTAISSKEFNQYFPNVGWVEHNPDEILKSVIFTVRDVIKKAGIKAENIAAAGLTNQRETTLVFNKKTGKTYYNAIVWQDKRTSAFCDELKRQNLDDTVYRKTGLNIDAYFSGSKLKWLLDSIQGLKTGAENGTAAFGTVDTYLLWHLSGGKIFATDYTNASRTMLFNIDKLCWDKDLIKLFNVPEKMLPKVYPSGYNYGVISKEIFGAEIPILACIGDQQSSLYGQNCTEVNSVKNTYGTGCFMLLNTGSERVNSTRGLITTLAASKSQNGKTARPDYALEGSVFTGGAVVKFLRDNLGLIDTAKDSETLALQVDSTDGVHFVPAFTGLGAPYWDQDAKGIICGMTRGTKKQHIIRAALEAIAFQVFDVLHAMEKDSGHSIKSLKVDGGASANNFLMQFQSDIIGVPVVRPTMLEVTAFGAALMAGEMCGFFENGKQNDYGGASVFTPTMQKNDALEKANEWHGAVFRARSK